MPDSPTIEFVRPAGLSERAPYAYAAVAHGVSRLVFTAGACPLDQDGNTVAAGDFTAQTLQAIANLSIALEATGASLNDVVKTTVYVMSAKREDLSAVWRVVERSFGTSTPPGTILGVTVLGYRNQLVEIEAIAALR